MALGDIIQTATGSGASPSVSAAFPSNITVGNMILAAVYPVNTEADTITSLQDTRLNGYQRAGPLSPSKSLTERVALYYAWNSPAGANTVQANISSANALLRCMEVESDMTTDPLDTVIYRALGNANPNAVLLSAKPNAFIAGAFAGVNQITAGLGFTSDFAGNSWNWELFQHLANSGNALNVNVPSVMAAGNWTMVAASFLLTPPGAAATPDFGSDAPYPGMYPLARRR